MVCFEEGVSAQSAPAGGSQRLMSLDALRGFDMFWIVGGESLVAGLAAATKWPWLQRLLPQFQHVPWEGFHGMDLVMPLFLFIVGTAMPFSLGKRLARGDSTAGIYAHVLRRVVILFILGMMVQGNLLAYDWSRIKFYSNTLQAIAAGYLIATVLMLHLSVAWQMLTTAGLLLLFWALLAWVPVPGHGAGCLTPDANFAIYLDKAILGRFQDGTCYSWILSSMNFGATTMLGVFAGQLLRSGKSEWAKAAGLAVAGVGCLIVGIVWSHWFPIIKHLWTSSFVLYSGGMSFLLLAGFYLLIDVCRLRRWAFLFVVIGANAIAVYVATHLFDFRLLGDVFVRGLSQRLGDWNAFVRALAGFAMVWLILLWMYRKKTFVRV